MDSLFFPLFVCKKCRQKDSVVARSKKFVKTVENTGRLAWSVRVCAEELPQALCVVECTTRFVSLSARHSASNYFVRFKCRVPCLVCQSLR